MKVLAAMSGGVDSSVAAARMVDAGHEVTGVHLGLARKSATAVAGSRGCCTLDDARDARRVADALDIPFYVWDFAERFSQDVMDDFIEQYQQGHTPNPCMRCNERIKFAAVLDKAIALGFDAVATGHYARRVDIGGVAHLYRARDSAKDQSYVLGVLQQWQLRHILFPLGEDVKDTVREEAAARGLLTAKKPDSHDICFIPDGDTAGFLKGRLGSAPGPIVHAQTQQVLGAHDGTFGYTVGQRRGLGMHNPLGDGLPLYVIGTDPKSNTVTVGPPELLDILSISGQGPTWADGVETGRMMAQVRAHAVPVPGVLSVDGDVVHFCLDSPFRALATGQTVVFYDQDRVVGSATVTATERVAESLA